MGDETEFRGVRIAMTKVVPEPNSRRNSGKRFDAAADERAPPGGRAALVHAQRVERVGAGRPAGRQPAREERDDEQRQSRGGEDARVTRAE